jgi:hypothetical protein
VFDGGQARVAGGRAFGRVLGQGGTPLGQASRRAEG